MPTSQREDETDFGEIAGQIFAEGTWEAKAIALAGFAIAEAIREHTAAIMTDEGGDSGPPLDETF